MDNWKVLASEYVLVNPWLKVRRDRCQTASGYIVEDYYVIERFDFVMMFAMTPDARVILVKQYKHGIGTVVCELPAGYVEHDEDPLEAAKRELLEETGFRAGTVIPVATLFPSPSVQKSRAHVFYCTDLQPVGTQSLDASEEIEVQLVELDKLRAAVSRNELVRDCASLSAIFSVLEKMDRGELRAKSN